MLCQLDALLDRLPHIILFQALSHRLSLRGVVSLRMHSLPYRTPFDPFALVVASVFKDIAALEVVSSALPIADIFRPIFPLVNTATRPFPRRIVLALVNSTKIIVMGDAKVLYALVVFCPYEIR